MGRANTELFSEMTHFDATHHLRDVVHTCEFETGRLIGLDNGLALDRDPGWAFFGAARAVLCDIDYVSALFCGCDSPDEWVSSARKSQRYIREVIAPAANNPRYEEFAEHLYQMYRHGTVHLRQPKRFENPKNEGTQILTWTLMGPRSTTLTLSSKVRFDLSHLERKRIAADVATLPVSVEELYADYLASVRHFAHLLEVEASDGKTELLARWRSAAERLIDPERSDLTW